MDVGGLERGATDGAGGGMVSGMTSAGNLAPHMPWTIAPIAAIHDAMATRREAIGTAPMASSYVDDLRPPFRCTTLSPAGAPSLDCRSGLSMGHVFNAGSTKLKTLPSPALLSTHTRPLCFSITVLTMDRPSPVPVIRSVSSDSTR